MAFSFSGLVSAVVGAVAKVANAVVNKLSPVAKSGGILGGLAGAVVGVAEAVLGVTAEFANACEDGEIDDEELFEDVFKLLVGAYVPMFAFGKSDSGNNDEVFNIFDVKPKSRYKYEPDAFKEQYLYGDDKSFLNAKISGGKYEGKAENKIVLYDEGKCSPKLKFGAEESLKTVELKGEMKQIGDNTLGLALEASGSVFNEKIGGGLSIGENEKTGKLDACVKGEAIATLAEGTTTEKFTILGIEFEVEQTGYIGGIGVEGEFGIVEGKLKGEMGACALIGGNISVSIGLAD
ncbi:MULTISPECIES: hypothetical protein [unclassified Clostridium]|uniref:hypothetical protein n=1 Tax=unclassified Clostridium TaxID=2614128 RepID=UPI00207AC08E|nr:MULTISPECIES: hypothetical protein [unclassified Clostridium]